MFVKNNLTTKLKTQKKISKLIDIIFYEVSKVKTKSSLHFR